MAISALGSAGRTLLARGASPHPGRQSEHSRRKLSPKDSPVIIDRGYPRMMATMNQEFCSSSKMGVMGPREKNPPFDLLDRTKELRAASRSHVPVPTSVILREHGPSLGETPDPIGEFRPVILTGLRGSRRE